MAGCRYYPESYIINTYDLHYADIHFHNDTGVAIEMNDTFQVFNIWTDYDHLNGFIFHPEEGKLECVNSPGTYDAIWRSSGNGVNNHIYHGKIFINEEAQNETIGGTVGQQSNFVQMIGFGHIIINIGDNITLRLQDKGDTTSGLAKIAGLKLLRIGN